MHSVICLCCLTIGVLLSLFQGSVFFSFPDGTGMLYTLHGTAEAPKAVATITHEMPSKTQYTEMVPVQNWLSKPQRYHHTTTLAGRLSAAY